MKFRGELIELESFEYTSGKSGVWRQACINGVLTCVTTVDDWTCVILDEMRQHLGARRVGYVRFVKGKSRYVAWRPYDKVYPMDAVPLTDESFIQSVREAYALRFMFGFNCHLNTLQFRVTDGVGRVVSPNEFEPMLEPTIDGTVLKKWFDGTRIKNVIADMITRVSADRHEYVTNFCLNFDKTIERIGDAPLAYVARHRFKSKAQRVADEIFKETNVGDGCDN